MSDDSSSSSSASSSESSSESSSSSSDDSFGSSLGSGVTDNSGTNVTGGFYNTGFPNGWNAAQESHHHHHPRFRRGRKRRGHLDLSTAPPWVKVFTWVGTLTLIAGFVVIGLGMAGSSGGSSGGVRDGGVTAGAHPFPGGGIAGEAFPGGGTLHETFPGGIPENERLITIDGHVIDLESGAIADPGSTSTRAARPVEETNHTGLVIALFVVGLLLSAVAALGHSTSRRR